MILSKYDGLQWDIKIKLSCITLKQEKERGTTTITTTTTGTIKPDHKFGYLKTAGIPPHANSLTLRIMRLTERLSQIYVFFFKNFT